MNTTAITVHWHDDTQPVYSVDFQPVSGNTESPRLVTGGGDNNIRIWSLTKGMEDGKLVVQVDFLSSLKKHTQAVNVTRFNHDGSLLASAGDDGTVIIWTLSPTIVKEFGSEDDEDIKESWIPKHVLRSSTSEIYDLSWSPNGRYVATGSMDHVVRIYDISQNGKLVNLLDSHSHYIQGIAWDPWNQYLVSQSADRSMNVYKIGEENGQLSAKLKNKVLRVDVPNSLLSKNPDSGLKSSMIYHSEALQSFFRRPAFSPDGSLLISPLGVYRYDEKNKDDNDKEKETNTVYIYTRGSLAKPVIHLPGLKKPAIAVAFSPIFYAATSSIFKLPYKMIFAVATQDSVVIYDTASLNLLGMVSNTHYSTITDLAWDKDGQSIIVSSADGFCSAIKFDLGVFGEIISQEEVEKVKQRRDAEILKGQMIETQKREAQKILAEKDIKKESPKKESLKQEAKKGSPTKKAKESPILVGSSPPPEGDDMEVEVVSIADEPEPPSIVNLLKARKPKKRVPTTLVG